MVVPGRAGVHEVSGEGGWKALTDLFDWEAELEAGDALAQGVVVIVFFGATLPGEGAAGEVDEHVGEGFEVVFGGLRLWGIFLLIFEETMMKRGGICTHAV